MRRLGTTLLAILAAVVLLGLANLPIGKPAPSAPDPPVPARAGALTPAPANAFEKGMVFGLFARHEPWYPDRSLEEMQRLGVTSVSIMIPWVTPHVRSLEMEPRSDMTPSDASLTRAIRAARRRGMSVMLMPFLYVDRMEAGEW